MISRNRNYSKKEPNKDAHRILIVCEGNDTEPKYFGFFKELSPRLDVIPIPSEDGKTDPVKLKEWAEQNLIQQPVFEFDYYQGDTIWFVVDTDEWEEQGKIGALRQFCQQRNNLLKQELKTKYDERKPYDAWLVAQSNPCFEIWEYYHIYDEKPDTEEVEKHASFKEFVHSAITGGFDPNSMPVEIVKAITNAKANYAIDDDGRLLLYVTEVYRLAEEMLPFVQRDINRLRNR